MLSAIGPRAAEAEASAAAFLVGAASSRIALAQFKDGYLPYQGGEIKAWLEALKADVEPDVVLTHRRSDAIRTTASSASSLGICFATT